jgi:predicted nucleic acid-binding protein
MLFMARMHVAENPFHAMCLKMEQKLAASADSAAKRSDILRNLKCKAGELDEVVESLLQQERIAKVEIPTKTRPAAGYKLIV